MAHPAPLPRLRFSRQELGGAWGDAGTLLPILVTLIVKNGMGATAALMLPGLLYIGSGLYYGVPLSVQPLKAMSAVAIAEGLGPEALAAAALLFGLILLFLAATGLIELVARLFPLPVVRGVQLAVGLLLIKTSINLWNRPQIGSHTLELHLGGVGINGGVFLAIACGLLLVVLRDNPRLPGALAALALGLIAGLALGTADGLHRIAPGPTSLNVGLPPLSQMGPALTLLVIPQLPLTLGNACIAATDVAHRYYGLAAHRVGYRSLLTSMGLAGLGAAVLQGMPLCHGSGGITAHYKLGARTAAAGLLIGVPLLLIAILFGKGAASIIGLIPLPTLGALLAYVGLEHALLVRDQRQPLPILLVATVGATSLAVNNLAVGFGAGIALHYTLRLAAAASRGLRPAPAQSPSPREERAAGAPHEIDDFAGTPPGPGGVGAE
ncbi:MAG TPA: putative sulfate/molybdate transporter [Dehalococcoidia bacterium]|nr:putative sulfate/molybdate transporter [Dehalococcoidia bacterium]